MHKFNKPNKNFKTILNAVVLIFGFFIMFIPIIKVVKISSLSFQRLVFLGIVLFFLFLPSIIYCMVTIKTKNMVYILFPAIFLLIAEYYFFHDFETWIASDANAAIGLIILPIYLFIILGFSYSIAFIIKKIIEYIRR